MLEGSVRKSGNAVRVTAQLTNIFAIQDEIAQAIAGALQVRLLPAANQPNLTGTVNLAAYELYLQGVSLWHEHTWESLEGARDLFEQAIALNAGFPTTHQWYATALLASGDLRGSEREYRIAQELDPRSRIIADNLALLQVYMGDFAAAEQTSRRTEAIAPDFVCSPEVQTFFAGADLPPLTEPNPCPAGEA